MSQLKITVQSDPREITCGIGIDLADAAKAVTLLGCRILEVDGEDVVYRCMACGLPMTETMAERGESQIDGYLCATCAEEHND